jgi:hypothetical protein
LPSTVAQSIAHDAGTPVDLDAVGHQLQLPRIGGAGIPLDLQPGAVPQDDPPVDVPSGQLLATTVEDQVRRWLCRHRLPEHQPRAGKTGGREEKGELVVKQNPKTGLSAIEQLTAEGVNVNVTLILPSVTSTGTVST